MLYSIRNRLKPTSLWSFSCSQRPALILSKVMLKPKQISISQCNCSHVQYLLIYVQELLSILILYLIRFQRHICIALRIIVRALQTYNMSISLESDVLLRYDTCLSWDLRTHSQKNPEQNRPSNEKEVRAVIWPNQMSVFESDWASFLYHLDSDI